MSMALTPCPTALNMAIMITPNAAVRNATEHRRNASLPTASLAALSPAENSCMSGPGSVWNMISAKEAHINIAADTAFNFDGELRVLSGNVNIKACEAPFNIKIL